MKDLKEGVRIGSLLYDYEMCEWGVVIQGYTENDIGIEYCDGGGREYGMHYIGLDDSQFDLFWKFPGSIGCPPVPRHLENISRYCFRHKYTENRKIYIKKFNTTIYYCPICYR